jgi:hypothetical protein
MLLNAVGERRFIETSKAMSGGSVGVKTASLRPTPKINP